MGFEIEKGIPIGIKSAGVRTSKYPWATMEIGDSFLVPDLGVDSMSAAASQAGKRLGRKFTCRTMNHGVRIWRVR